MKQESLCCDFLKRKMERSAFPRENLTDINISSDVLMIKVP